MVVEVVAKRNERPTEVAAVVVASYAIVPSLCAAAVKVISITCFAMRSRVLVGHDR